MLPQPEIPVTRPPIRRAVVTGGGGFLGSWVCEELLSQGISVVCFDNFLTGRADNVEQLANDPGFELVCADASEGIEVAGPVDLVLHLASPASPVQYQRFPVETLKVGSFGTMHSLDLARRNSARFVLASTSEVYGDPLEHPQREDYWGNVNPVGPRSAYDEAKRFGEALTTAYRQAYEVDTAIVRIFNTYGPRMRIDDGRVIPTFIRQALADEPLTVAGDGRQTRSICYVSDTVRGIVSLAQSGHPGPVNIGNPDEVSVLELAEHIGKLTGGSCAVTFVPLPVDDPKRRCPDIARARELLGWTPEVSAEDGLTRTIEWFTEGRSGRR